MPACFCCEEWQAPHCVNPGAVPWWCGLDPGLAMLTLVGWQSRQALVDPRCGFVPCVVAML